MSFLFIAIGGFFGSIARFYLSQKLNGKLVGTWIANVSGSILFGCVASLYMADQFSHSLYLLVGIGFCGAYTTFSTFGHETLQLLLKQQYQSALLYVASSLSLSLGFVFLIFFFIN